MSSVARGDRMCGRYLLLARVGSGGQAEVWRARDAERGTDVALKILRRELASSPEAWAVLEHEYAIARQLGHPGILKVYEPQRCEGWSILPMDYAAGGDLSRLRGEPYTRIVPALISVAQALEHAHQRGIVHRDLKPGNVLLDEDGRTLMADFGVASSGGTSPFADHGSPFSASPQALRGEAPAPADDVYGLGALAYELLSGYPPFYPKFEPKRVIEEPPPDLRSIHPLPPRLAVLVMRMLSKSRDARPPSMREVIDELNAALHDTLTLEQSAVAEPGEPQGEPEPRAAQALPPADTPAPDDAAARSPTYHPSTLVDTSRVVEAPVVEGASADPIITTFEPALGTAQGTTDAPPARRRTALWLALAALAAAVVGVFAWLPRVAPPSAPAPLAAPDPAAAAAAERAAEAAQALEDAVAQARTRREAIEQRLASVDAQGGSVWGGAEFASAKASLAEAGAAIAAREPPRAIERLDAAENDLTTVEARAPAALAVQLEAGEAALASGQSALAAQAFELALLIEPGNARASAGLARARALDDVLPALADAANAESSGDLAGALAKFEAVLARDPNNPTAREGRDRVRAAQGSDAYARVLASGFQALRARRLGEARVAFERAAAMRPGAREPKDGLEQVTAALQGVAGTEARERGGRLEEAERWGEALRIYEDILKADASIRFAREGRDRVAPRADLDRRLQGIIDRPDRLAAPEVRVETDRLLARAREIEPVGPVLRSQIARLDILLPEYDKPVRVAIESDNLTSVTIARVGPLGAFLRREIDLKPGRYTVLGTREGFRDIRRDITISPGAAVQTVSVACVEPI
jgi:tetratricopeptide (TPR) repeat protein